MKEETRDCDAPLPPLRVFIVDDEELARMRLGTLVQSSASPQARVVGEAADAAQANAWLDEHECDLIFLDIGMPGLDGLALASRWLDGARPRPPVVFVTAHAEHALRAFDLEALDYLTKPVRRERLQATLTRAAQRLGARTVPPRTGSLDEPVIVVADRGQRLRIPVSEVLYLKADLKYVTVRTANGSYLLDDALSEWEPRLGSGFLRIHRNALVACRAIRALARKEFAAQVSPNAREMIHGHDNSAWVVRIAPVDEWLVVSRRQLPLVREALSKSDA